ncbi:MAG TPA: hypothetical protein V6D00_00310 [Pantanalinema sp.]
MVRRISSEPAIARPLRAPQAPAPAQAPAVKPVPASPPRPAKGEKAWMSEILFEAQFDPRFQNAHPGGAGEAERPGASRPGTFTRSALLEASEEAPVGELPRSRGQYRALLGRLFDAKAEDAAEAMRDEPVLSSMREVWQPGRPEVNRRVASEFMRYFLPKLGEAYGFKPCPVQFDDTLSGGYNGLYDLRHDRIYLPERTLSGTFADFIDVVAHEEMHCMQERLIARLHLIKHGTPLTPDERAIATYWRNEQPKYRSAMANGSAMSPETRARYREIGQEYHSIRTGAYMSARLSTP